MVWLSFSPSLVGVDEPVVHGDGRHQELLEERGVDPKAIVVRDIRRIFRRVHDLEGRHAVGRRGNKRGSKRCVRSRWCVLLMCKREAESNVGNNQMNVGRARAQKGGKGGPKCRQKTLTSTNSRTTAILSGAHPQARSCRVANGRSMMHMFSWTPTSVCHNSLVLLTGNVETDGREWGSRTKTRE